MNDELVGVAVGLCLLLGLPLLGLWLRDRWRTPSPAQIAAHARRFRDPFAD